LLCQISMRESGIYQLFGSITKKKLHHAKRNNKTSVKVFTLNASFVSRFSKYRATETHCKGDV